jgi:hypothetical protein
MKNELYYFLFLAKSNFHSVCVFIIYIMLDISSHASFSLSRSRTHTRKFANISHFTQHAAVDMRSGGSVCASALRIQNLLHCITGCAHEKICWRIYGRERDAFHARIQRTEGGMQIPPVHNYITGALIFTFVSGRVPKVCCACAIRRAASERSTIHANLQRAVECKTTSAPFQMLIKQTLL